MSCTNAFLPAAALRLAHGFAARLDRVGCFEYSAVEGAAANDLPDHVPKELKHERWQRFMQLQSEISRARLARNVGRRIMVLIDELDGDHAIARSSADAPGIDGVVRIDDGGDLSPGSFVTVDITASTEYDLVGRVSSAQLDDRA